jgi:hypothetical protein
VVTSPEDESLERIYFRAESLPKRSFRQETNLLGDGCSFCTDRDSWK